MLKLINAELAKVFGLPPNDLDEKEALSILEKQSLGVAHLDNAISAGAFKKENATQVKKTTSEKVTWEVNNG